MKKIMNKIVLIAISASMLTAILIGIPLSIFINDTFESNLKANAKQLNDNFDKIAKLEVETAISLLAKINSMTESGELESTKAKVLAKSLLRDIRYDKEGYFWADTYLGDNVVLLGKKDVEGTNRLESKDVKGKYLIKEIIENGRKPDGGFTTYWFPKKGTTIPLPKRGYSKSFEPYQWVIGTGNYVDDIDNIVSKQAEEIREQKSGVLIKSVLTLLFVLILISIIAIYVGRKISKPITIVTEAANSLAKGEKVDDIKVNSNDETKHLATAFNLMKSKIQTLIDETSKLSQAAANGHLDYRAKANDLDGSYREIIIGINAALDNLISPLNVSAEYIDRISKGDIPPQITDEFQGDFNMIKNNLNQCIKSIQLLVADSNEIFNSAINGNLNFRADAQQHNGEFRNIISGVNATMDRLVGLIDQMPLSIQIVDKDSNVLFQNKHLSNL